MRIGHIALLLALLSGTAAAQTAVDPAEFMPIGVFNRWQFTEFGGDPADTFNVVVKNVTVVRGNPRYNLRFPDLAGLGEVRLLVGFENGSLLLYAARVTDNAFSDDLEVDRLNFSDNPVVLATPGTMMDGVPIDTTVDTKVKVSLGVGPKTVSTYVKVTGKVSAWWQSEFGSLVTPSGTYDAADLVSLMMTFDLNFFTDHEQIDLDKDVFETVGILLARNVGVARVDAGSSTWLLTKAILPGRTIGDFPDNTDIEDFSFPAPGLLNLNGATGTAAGDDLLDLTDLYLDHALSGKLTLTGYLDVKTVVPAEETAVPFTLQGKAKLLKDGTAKFILKGKVKHEALAKKISIAAKAIISDTTTQVMLVYKAGRDAEKIPIGGEFPLTLAPTTADSVSVLLNGIVDAHLEPSEKKRMLGTEGWLDVAGVQFPVTVYETLKYKPDGSEVRVYKVVQTGTTKPVIAKFTATSGLVPYALTKFKAKILSLKVKPEDVAEVLYNLD